MTYSVDAARDYIIQAAQARGIDPTIALRVAESEGLKQGVWQSNVFKNGVQERSYGPFQLYMGGGLGNKMLQETGLDPADKSNWKQGIDYALDSAVNEGWGPWYGAKRVGITGFDGINTPGSSSVPKSSGWLTQTKSAPDVQAKASSGAGLSAYANGSMSLAQDNGAFDQVMNELPSLIGNFNPMGQQQASGPALPQLQPIRATMPGYL